MARPRTPRLPYEPLAAHLPAFQIDAAAVVGINKATLADWRTNGVPAPAADHAAVRAGTHPWTVWGLAWVHAMDAIEGVDPDRREEAA